LKRLLKFLGWTVFAEEFEEIVEPWFSTWKRSRYRSPSLDKMLEFAEADARN